MAATPSNMMPLGTVAPAFELPDTVSGRKVHLDQLKSDRATVIMFICNHCPYVKHINAALVQLAVEYMEKGVAFIAISANDMVHYPQDAPDKMSETAREEGYPFPYLYDESQSVAKAYDAACTPDFYVFNGEMKCVYRGQFDDSRPGNAVPATGRDLRAALDDVLAGREVQIDQKPSIGCNIKWKS
jgi:peroxiredoxin